MKREIERESLKKAVLIISLIIISLTIFMSMYYMKGSKGNEVSKFYLKNAILLIKSPNTVNAIVWEFRGYDTLGEELVLITATMSCIGVLITLFSIKKKGVKDGRHS